MSRSRPTRPAATALPLLLLLLALAPAAAGAQQPSRVPDVHYVPSPPEVVDAMLGVARVGCGDVLYDLGSGDGRIPIAAAKRFGTRGVGIDIDPALVRESRRNAARAGVARLVRFREADLFRTDLREATVVTLYLMPHLNLRLRPKLFRELRPGARVASHAFDMGDWHADSTLDVEGRTVYHWVVPANVGGRWTLAVPGGGRYTLQLHQKFQRVMAEVERDGARATVEDARVRADSVSLALLVPRTPGAAPDTLRLRGRVAGGLMTGDGWRATREGPAPPLGQEGESPFRP